MTRVAISVEGETEEEFVKQLLLPHLVEHDILVTPIKPGGRGGDIHVGRIAPHMAKLSWGFDAVTSLEDFYGFRHLLPGETVQNLEKRIDTAIGGHNPQAPHLVPQFAYAQQYEFEALLFSAPSSFGFLPGLPGLPPTALAALGAIAGQFSTPEDINGGFGTHPSKRIEQCFARYRKTLHGPLIAKNIGLAKIRSACPRFDGWVSRLEAL